LNEEHVVGEGDLGGGGLSRVDVVDGHLVQVVLQAALDGVGAGLFPFGEGVELLDGDAAGLDDALSRQLPKGPVLLRDDLDGVLFCDELLQGRDARLVHELLREHDVREGVPKAAAAT